MGPNHEPRFVLSGERPSESQPQGEFAAIDGNELSLFEQVRRRSVHGVHNPFFMDGSFHGKTPARVDRQVDIEHGGKLCRLMPDDETPEDIQPGVFTGCLHSNLAEWRQVLELRCPLRLREGAGADGGLAGVPELDVVDLQGRGCDQAGGPLLPGTADQTQPRQMPGTIHRQR